MVELCKIIGHDWTEKKPCNICGCKKGEWKCPKCDSIQKKGELCYCERWIKENKPEVNKPSLLQNNKKEDGIPPTNKLVGILPKRL